MAQVRIATNDGTGGTGGTGAVDAADATSASGATGGVGGVGGVGGTWELTVGYDDEGGRDGAVGDPLVLVHGHPFDRSMWRPQLRWFSRYGRRVIAPDLRGYGETTVVPGTTTLDVFARDLAALLDHLGVRRCVLGGLSMGGQIVMEFLRLFPERVGGLLLADTLCAPETPGGRAARYAMAERLLAEGMAGYAAEALPRMMAAYNVEALPSVARHVLGMMRGTPPEGAAAALRGRAVRPDYAPVLRRVAVPTLVVVGQDDEYTPVADARRLHELIPGSVLTVVPGAGHLPNLERSTEFNAALRAFLDGLDRPATRPATPGNAGRAG
ncbi:alpha/beta fold hydrolase [Streptomyces hoynatensis]|uniref:Alpha/beta fold hydrolase n=1 Tax=Streptomyces hoynatensis TaxID=1141874 RepID=A0A3A9YMP8_9ACTN|nr:alpha/beta fold hydrolase [Streptomyces hoynatensis]RKN35866.1 alpha/beta fold hydrolase [Streptomyces hoynatensis]